MSPFVLAAVVVTQTIVVTGERIEQPLVETTAAVTVLRAEQLRSAKTLGDALTLVPGLQLIDVNPGAPPMIASRGFFGAGEVEYLQLIVDGVPRGDAESGLADWRSIPVEDIDRVEVLRGPGSSLFGDAAIGGVVQVFRKRAPHVSLSYGSFGTSRLVAGSGGFSAGTTQSDGFREHSANRQSFASASFTRGRVQGSLDVSDRDRDDPGPRGAEALFANDHESSTRVNASLRYRGAMDVVVRAQHRDGEQTRTFLFAPDFGDTATRDVATSGFGLALSRTMKHVIAGIDADRESLDSAYGEIRGKGSRLRGAAFASGEWRVTPIVRIAAGARWDSIADTFASVHQDDRAFSPRLGVSIDLGPANAFAEVSRAFKAPTLDQRFDQRAFGPVTISNPALRAQHANDLELGLRGEGWELTAYRMAVDDEIDFDVQTFRYGNIGRSLHRGIEASWSRAPLRLSYAWTRVAKRDDPARQLKNIAEHVARAGVDAGLVHVDAEYSANRWLDDENRIPLDDALLIDVRLTKTIHAVEASIEAKNILDQDYAPLGFLAGDTPFVYPGAGRSFGVTLTWKGGRS